MADLFAINGTYLWAPDGYQEAPMPVIGYNLRGEPIRQGYPSFIFTWSIVTQERLTAILAEYDPLVPLVTLTYIDKATGIITTKNAMMEEPIVGARFIVYYQNLAIKFTRIEEV